MSRVVPLFLLLIPVAAIGTFAVAEPELRAQQVRDPVPAQQQGPAQPAVRRIPVGNASISGTVTDSATGRPISDVRVMLNGSSTGPEGGTGPGREGRALTIGVAGSGAGSGVQIGRGIGPGAPGSLSLSRLAFTDAQGRFSFEKLPAGQFNIGATRNQFLATSYGQPRTGGQGTAIRLIDGQRFVANLQLHRGGIITGLVTTPAGEPEARAQVRALRVVTSNGIRRLQQSGNASADDRGAYRIFGLAPGEYVVAAQPLGSASMSERQLADARAVEEAIASGAVQPPAGPGLPAIVLVPVTPPPPPGTMEPSSSYLPTYFPATLVPAEATPITVGANTELNGIDLQVQRSVSSGIEGMIAMPAQEGVAVQVSLVSTDSLLGNVMSTRPNQDGRFQFRGIAPGRYTVMAVTVPGAPPSPVFLNGVQMPPQPARLGDAEKLWARADVTVESQSSAQVSLSLQPGRSISGSILFDMERPPDLSRSRIMVMLNPVAFGAMPSYGPQPQAQVQPDGRFTLNGVVPGTYTLRATGLMKSSIVDGRDTLDFPLELDGHRDIIGAVLTLTDRATEVTGLITDSAGAPAFQVTIVAAATDPRFWTPFSRRIATARPDTSGRYAFRSLPPGDYFLAAVTDLEPGRQFDQELLRTLVGASVHVTLADGGRVTQGLRVGR